VDVVRNKFTARVICCRQLGAANECNQQLQVALQNEKLASAATSRNFEGKLADIEDCMMQKVREVATARDVQTGLRIELNSLKSMIENEEERSVLQTCMHLGVAAQQSYSTTSRWVTYIHR